MKRILAIACLAEALLLTAAPTLYVDNLKGNDANDGSREKPLASIERACKLVQTGGRIEVTNTGTPYSLPYDGPGKPRGLRLLRGGTAEQPLVVEGNGAVISGLAVIPAEAWKREAEGIYSLPFDPMSNFFRRDMSKNYWLPGTQIWFVDGKAAPNLLDRESLEKTPNGFWWNKKERKVLYHLPAGKQLADLKIQLPANYGFYIHRSHTIVRNFTMMFSWNDGFDAAETPKHAMYVNCLAYNSCGQGMSIHDASDVYYEECGAVNCASSAVCNVGQSSGTLSAVRADRQHLRGGSLSERRRVSPLRRVPDRRPGTGGIDLAAGPLTNHLLQLHADRQRQVQSGVAGGGRIELLRLYDAERHRFHLAGIALLHRRSERGEIAAARLRPLLREAARSADGAAHPPGREPLRADGRTLVPGKPEVPGTSPALTKLQLDRDSKTEAFELTGRKSSENPHAVDRRSLRIGSKLPESVWKIYDRLKQYEATPAGIVKKGAVAR
ncbi:MAG: hypothetical protein L6W00_11780 [Lentisphaeria bacterium]|nr:MAG: hypothetical protein L6W00_11780 [Lentisphaeria bacterium]